MAATAEGVRGAFSDVDVRLDAASLKEAQRLCTTYNLDADDLALKWEVFAYNKVRGMEGGGSREGGGGTLGGCDSLKREGRAMCAIFHAFSQPAPGCAPGCDCAGELAAGRARLGARGWVKISTRVAYTDHRARATLLGMGDRWWTCLGAICTFSPCAKAPLTPPPLTRPNTTPKGHEECSETLLEQLGEQMQRAEAKKAAAQGGMHAQGSTWEVVTPAAAKASSRLNRSARSSGSPLTPGGAAVFTPSPLPVDANAAVHAASAMKAGGSSPFTQRAAALAIQQTLNAEAMEAPPADAGDAMQEDAPALVRVAEGVPPNARFMFERLEDKVEYLQARIAAFEEALHAQHGVTADWPVYAATAGEEAVTVVGRIVVDGDEGRLNAASVLLEGSVRHSGGQRVRVGLDKLESFSLFPGQVVAFEGHNPSGFTFVPRKLYAGAAAPIAVAPKAEAEGETAAASAGPSDVVVAAGPYTSPTDLGYEALDSLLAYVAKARPAHLMLLGPFVDEQHGAIKTGLIEHTFEEVFRRQVLERCRTALAGTGVRVAVAPSTRDVHAVPAFPQPPMSLAPAATKDAAHVESLPNPAVVRAGGLTLGACTADVVRELAGVEVSKAPALKDRMARLAAHVLRQRCFYPSYPPAPGAMMDTTQAAHFVMGDSPDVLLLPSDISPFAKLLDADALGVAGDENAAKAASVAAVNPGRLMKGPSGGTFARIRFVGSDGQGAAAERTRVDILRI